MASSKAILRLKAGREKSLYRLHPWVFSGAVESLTGAPDDGATVRIVNNEGAFLGWGAYSAHSKIRARIWTWDEAEQVDEGFFQRRLETAIQVRDSLPGMEQSEAIRLVNGESDALPGLVIDRYGDWAVIQFLSSGPEHWKREILEILRNLVTVSGIYERSDVDVRKLEGLEERAGLLWGDAPPERVLILENGLNFFVDLRRGHKTGFYLDQRFNRRRVRTLADKGEVLDCFCYTGGFTVNALAGGAASVMSVDSSADALALARDNLALNGFPVERFTPTQGDVFQVLRMLRDQGRQFDLVILDPPKFAPTINFVEKAARGYKDINLLGLKLLRPGGKLVTFSCSGGVDAALFQKIIAGAALDAGAETGTAQIIEHLSQAGDHPVSLNFPEGEYLKGLVIHKK